MVLGVMPHQQHYLELPDASLSQRLGEFTARITVLAQQIKPDAIVSFDTTGFDFHADHRASHAASLAVANNMDVDFYARLPQASQEGFALFGDPALKRRAVLQHVSQYSTDLKALTSYIGHPAMERYDLVTVSATTRQHALI